VGEALRQATSEVTQEELPNDIRRLLRKFEEQSRPKRPKTEDDPTTT
jgi:hypothetical protein